MRIILASSATSPMNWLLRALAALIVVSLLAVGVYAWLAVGDNEITASGYVAIFSGVVFTVALGGTLLGLVFYSHSHGYDEQGGGTSPARGRE